MDRGTWLAIVHAVAKSWPGLSRGTCQHAELNHCAVYMKLTQHCESAMLLLLFSGPVMPSSLWLHGLQHTRPPCLLASPGVCPSSCSLHWWCHPAISSSDAFFSSCPRSFPASGTFPMSCLFASDDQNTGASASASVLPVNIQDWSPLRLTGLISLLSKGILGVFSNTTVWRHQFFGSLSSLWSSSQLYSNKIKRKMRSSWISCYCFSRVWLFVTLGL